VILAQSGGGRLFWSFCRKFRKFALFCWLVKGAFSEDSTCFLDLLQVAPLL